MVRHVCINEQHSRLMSINSMYKSAFVTVVGITRLYTYQERQRPVKHVPLGRWNGGQLLVLDLCTHSVARVQVALH